jgi:quercetin dioxygenase-like cupin family protein
MFACETRFSVNQEVRSMNVSRFGVLACLVGGVASGALLAEENPSSQAHIMVRANDMTWVDGPPSLPAGAKSAVIEGNPTKAGLFTMRVKIPANYRIPAHWHPADEHVTVISGTFHMGMGDKLDTSAGRALPAGSFAVMPATSRHFAYTNEETVIQLHGVGPWGITYVNPADDPRSPK